MKMKILIVGLSFFLTNLVLANQEIYCETVVQSSQQAMTVELNQMDGNNYKFKVTTQFGIHEGNAKRFDFTTGSTIAGDQFKLSISKFDKSRPFPVRWGQFWALVHDLNIPGADVVCRSVYTLADNNAEDSFLTLVSGRPKEECKPNICMKCEKVGETSYMCRDRNGNRRCVCM